MKQSLVLALTLSALAEMQNAFHMQPTTIHRYTTMRNSKQSLSLSSSLSPISSSIQMQPLDYPMMIGNDDASSFTTVMTASSSTVFVSAVSDLSLDNTNVIVFIVGLIPFVWATIEFWRRIAVGEPFGTSKDSVLIVRPTTTTTIGQDNNPSQSRGRQTLGQGALIVAYILFSVAAGVILLTLYSVLTSNNSMEPSALLLEVVLPDETVSLLK